MNAWRKTIGDRTTACIILATIDHGLAENAERVLLTMNGLTEVSIGFAKLICIESLGNFLFIQLLVEADN